MKKKSILLVCALALFGTAILPGSAQAWRGKTQTTHYIDKEGDHVDVVSCRYHLFIKECNSGEGDVIPDPQH
ncbi:hypothetical protein [Roseivirga sp.]|uniref:hypothetical protein n=1 Tax=Roseivirga sp. TaxID=1964215 RepID=UPI003B522C56